MNEYFFSTSHLKTCNIRSKCPKCESEGTTQMEIEYTFFKLLIVPVFPLKKRTGKTQCNTCGFTTNEETMPEEFSKTYVELVLSQKYL